jgi:hypothetical protein
MAVDPEKEAIRRLAAQLLVLANNAYQHVEHVLQHLTFGGKMATKDKVQAFNYLDEIQKTVDVFDDALYALVTKGNKRAFDIITILRGMRDPGHMNKGHIKDAQTSLGGTAQDYERVMRRINTVAATIVKECDSL